MEWNGFETVRLVYMFSVKDLIDYLIQMTSKRINVIGKSDE